MKPGFHDLPCDQYLADCCEAPSLSSHIATLLLAQSPLHAWHAHPKLNPDYQPEHSEEADAGSVAHELLLTGDESRIVVVAADDWRTKAAQQQRDDARANKLIPILGRKFEEAQAMVKAARDYLDSSEIAGILQDGHPERVVVWQEFYGVDEKGALKRQGSPIWCRARTDWLTTQRNVILDYKTTAGSAEPSSWIRSQLAQSGYDVQAAFYIRGVHTFTSGGKPPTFVFFVQENYPPYSCSLVSLAPSMMELAERKVQRAINAWASCMASGNWPAYSAQIAWAEAQAWQMSQEEERELTDVYDKLQAEHGLQP